MYTERTADELSNYLNQLMDDANSKTKKECPLTNFVFCPLTGLDLAISIKDYDPLHQEAVNTASVENKHNTVRTNKKNNLPTPWTSAYVHHLRRARYIHCYDRLCEDGLHPSPGLLEYWADLFVKFAAKLYV